MYYFKTSDFETNVLSKIFKVQWNLSVVDMLCSGHLYIVDTIFRNRWYTHMVISLKTIPLYNWHFSIADIRLWYRRCLLQRCSAPFLFVEMNSKLPRFLYLQWILAMILQKWWDSSLLFSFQLMQKCWYSKANQRSTFDQIERHLSSMLADDFRNLPCHIYYQFVPIRNTEIGGVVKDCGLRTDNELFSTKKNAESNTKERRFSYWNSLMLIILSFYIEINCMHALESWFQY